MNYLTATILTALFGLGWIIISLVGAPYLWQLDARGFIVPVFAFFISWRLGYRHTTGFWF